MACRRGAVLVALLVVLALAADDGPKGGSAAPRPPAVPSVDKKPAPAAKPALGVGLLTSTRMGAVSSARLVGKYVSIARPYVLNPTQLFQLSANVKTFLPLFVVALYYLIFQVLWPVSFLSIIFNPDKFITNVMLATVFYHASFMALRGPPKQISKLMASERQTTSGFLFVSLLSAAYAKLNNNGSVWNKVALRFFAGILLFAFLCDLLAHVPYGRKIANHIMGCYIAILRWLLARVGLKFEPPAWMKSLAGVAPPPAPKAEQQPLSASVSSWFTSWLPSSLIGADAADSGGSSSRAISSFVEREAMAVLVRLGQNASLPAEATILGFRPVTQEEVEQLAKDELGHEAELRPFKARWLKAPTASGAAEGEGENATAAADDGWWGYERIPDSEEAEGAKVEPLSSSNELEAAANREGQKLPTPLNLHADALLRQVMARLAEREEAADEGATRPSTPGANAATLPQPELDHEDYDELEDDDDFDRKLDEDEDEDEDEEASVETIEPSGRGAAGKPMGVLADTAAEVRCMPTEYAGVLLCVAHPDGSSGSYWDALADKAGFSWLSSAATTTGAKAGSWWSKTSDWFVSEMEPVTPAVGGGGMAAVQPLGASASGAGGIDGQQLSQLSQQQQQQLDEAAALQALSPEDWAEVKQFGMKVVESTSDGVQSVRRMFVQLGGGLFSSTTVTETTTTVARSGKGSKKKKGKKGKKARRSSAPQITSRVMQMRARPEQVIAFLIARQHQHHQLMKVAAAVAQVDGDGGEQHPLASPTILAALEAMGASGGGAAGAGAGAGAAAGGYPAMPEGSIPPEMMSTATALVPYGAAVADYARADYASFLVAELQRVLDEGVLFPSGGVFIPSGLELSAEEVQAARELVRRKHRAKAKKKAKKKAEKKAAKAKAEADAERAAQMAAVKDTLWKGVESVKGSAESVGSGFKGLFSTMSSSLFGEEATAKNAVPVKATSKKKAKQTGNLKKPKKGNAAKKSQAPGKMEASNSNSGSEAKASKAGRAASSKKRAVSPADTATGAKKINQKKKSSSKVNRVRKGSAPVSAAKVRGRPEGKSAIAKAKLKKQKAQVPLSPISRPARGSAGIDTAEQEGEDVASASTAHVAPDMDMEAGGGDTSPTVPVEEVEEIDGSLSPGRSAALQADAVPIENE